MGRALSEHDEIRKFRARVGLRIRRLRLKRFATQKDFADALASHGLSATKAAVSLWESGDRTPHVADLPFFARTLRVKVRDLLPPS